MTQPFDRISPAGPSRGLWGSVMSLFGALATGVAVTIGAVLALFTAAAVAVIAVVAGILVFLASFVFRARRPARAAASPNGDGVIEARKVGDTWVAYGWERHGR